MFGPVTHWTNTYAGVKAKKKNPKPEIFQGAGQGGSTCKACNDCGNFIIWKDAMAKLLPSLFKLIFFLHEYMVELKNESYIIHLENYELYHRLSTLGVWQYTNLCVECAYEWF